MAKIIFTLKNKKEAELFFYKILPLYYDAIESPTLLTGLAHTVSNASAMVFSEWRSISKSFDCKFCVLDFHVNDDKSVSVVGSKVK